MADTLAPAAVQSEVPSWAARAVQVGSPQADRPDTLVPLPVAQVAPPAPAVLVASPRADRADTLVPLPATQADLPTPASAAPMPAGILSCPTQAGLTGAGMRVGLTVVAPCDWATRAVTVI